MSAATADASNVKIEEKPPFKKTEPMAYAMGDIGNGFYFQLVTNYALIYMTDALGINPLWAGWIIFFGKLISAFTDFGTGVWADNAPLREDGRYHWFVRTLRYPLMAVIILTFLPFVSSWPMAARVVYMTVIYIAGVACYSATSAPYGSFASVSTPVVKHRDEMAAGRGFGSTAGGIIVTFILPLVMYTTVKDSTGADKKILNGPVLIWVAIIFAILLWLCYQITLKGTVERIRVEKTKNEHVPLGKALKYMFTNRAMVALMLAALLLIFAQMFAGAVNSYLYKDYFNNTAALAILAVQNVPVLIVAPFVPAICDKFGKKLVCGILLVFTTVVYVIMFFMHITNPYVFVGMSIVAIFGNGVFGLMVWSFITDIIDDIQVKTHTREDGTVYTGYMFARKIGQALSGLLPAVVLAATGYVTATSGQAVVQSASTLNNIYAVATLAPAIGNGLIALILLFFYPLSGEVSKKNAAILEERRAKGEM
ncbi:sodium/sugar (Glycoside-Pentoside-Hexuronide) symporter [Bifidobacterium goeldii]|uniref:Sodium/sugar (Glycoside-Pentoside-Hexuronide) symporter n=1 Tax=Bifidobacterium goeldii TaxID=2306975 RepID=A0A430FLE0_9BIFI|nr:MFS transporter [Bifidobacterium goeldii]RSX53572.1 sodium/sugar (Glycoside-Pentoside-Hexuronide) symporter [Bifidobacterium goeldii]